MFYFLKLCDMEGSDLAKSWKECTVKIWSLSGTWWGLIHSSGSCNFFCSSLWERNRRGSCGEKETKATIEESTRFRKLRSCWKVYNERYIPPPTKSKNRACQLIKTVKFDIIFTYPEINFLLIEYPMLVLLFSIL